MSGSSRIRKKPRKLKKFLTDYRIDLGKRPDPYRGWRNLKKGAYVKISRDIHGYGFRRFYRTLAIPAKQLGIVVRGATDEDIKAFRKINADWRLQLDLSYYNSPKDWFLVMFPDMEMWCFSKWLVPTTIKKFTKNGQ